MSVVALAGERVILRQLVPADAGRVAAFHRDNVARLARWSPPAPEGLLTETYWRERLAQGLLEFETGSSLRLHVLRRDDRGDAVLGEVNLSQIARGPFQNAYLGYKLDHRAEGQGLMTESLRLLVAHAFGAMRLHRISANYMPENARSARVLARLGFVPEGIAKDYLFIDGAWRDHVLTSLTNPAHPGPA